MKKRNERKMLKVAIGMVLSIFMVSSIGSVILFYGQGSSDTTLTFNGKKFRFSQVGDGQGNFYYEVKSGRTSFISYYLPGSLGIKVLNHSDEIIQNANFFYLTFNPEESDIRYVDLLRLELRNSLPPERLFQDATVSGSSLYDLPVITCENSTSVAPVLLLKNSTLTRIASDSGCVIIEYLPQDMAKIRDALIYLLHGVEI